MPRLLAFLAAEVDETRHVHALLLWLHQLMLSHGRMLREQRDAHDVPLRALHKSVCTRYDELSKVCHGNLFTLRVLADQLALLHGAEEGDEAAA